MPNIQISGDSTEAIAYALVNDLMTTEKHKDDTWQPDKEWLIQTYADCLDGIRNFSHFKTRQ